MTGEESVRKDDRTGREYESRKEGNAAIDTEKSKEIDMLWSFQRKDSPANTLARAPLDSLESCGLQTVRG